MKRDPVLRVFVDDDDGRFARRRRRTSRRSILGRPAGQPGWVIFGYEEVASAGDRLDPVSLIAKRPAQARHLEAQIAFVDCGGWPDVPHDRVLADDFAAGGEEQDEEVEGTASQADSIAVHQEYSSFGKGDASAERHLRSAANRLLKPHAVDRIGFNVPICVSKHV